MKPKRALVGKKGKKGAQWKFTLDLTHPVEDGILDSANFVSSDSAVKLLTRFSAKQKGLLLSMFPKG